MIYFSDVYESSPEDIQYVKDTYTVPTAEWGGKYFSFQNYAVGHRDRSSKTITNFADTELVKIYKPILNSVMRKHNFCQPGTGLYGLQDMWGEVYNDEIQTVGMSRQQTSPKVIASWVHLMDVPGESGLSFLSEDGQTICPEHQNNSIIFFAPGTQRCVDAVDSNRVFAAGNILKLM